MDLGGRLVDEPLAVQHVEHRLAFGDTQRARRQHTGPQVVWRGARQPRNRYRAHAFTKSTEMTYIMAACERVQL